MTQAASELQDVHYSLSLTCHDYILMFTTLIAQIVCSLKEMVFLVNILDKTYCTQVLWNHCSSFPPPPPSIFIIQPRFLIVFLRSLLYVVYNYTIVPRHPIITYRTHFSFYALHPWLVLLYIDHMQAGNHLKHELCPKHMREQPSTLHYHCCYKQAIAARRHLFLVGLDFYLRQ